MKKLMGFIKRKDLWRPIVHKSFIRMMIILVVSFAWEKFVDTGVRGIGFALQTLGLVLAALGWFSYLKMDGILLDIGKLFNKGKKKKDHEKKDMGDRLQDDVDAFQDLDTEEKGYTSLMACEIVGILAVIIGCFVKLYHFPIVIQPK